MLRQQEAMVAVQLLQGVHRVLKAAVLTQGHSV
jgi:hypothetical protein